MKKAFLIISIIFSVIQAKAQSLEFSVQANSGMSHFTGATTLKNTFLNGANTQDHTGYPNGTGNIYAPGFGAGFQLQYTFKSGFLAGAQAGFEQFSSKVDINGVYDNSMVLYANVNGGSGVEEVPATGHVTDHLDYINLNPYIGYRFLLNKVKLDLLPGIDIALGTGSSETVNVKASDGTYYNRSSLTSGKPSTDVRMRMGAVAYYYNWGITASYSKGLKDFNSGRLSDSVLPPLHSELFRIGLLYRLK